MPFNVNSPVRGGPQERCTGGDGRCADGRRTSETENRGRSCRWTVSDGRRAEKSTLLPLGEPNAYGTERRRRAVTSPRNTVGKSPIAGRPTIRARTGAYTVGVERWGEGGTEHYRQRAPAEHHAAARRSVVYKIFNFPSIFTFSHPCPSSITCLRFFIFSYFLTRFNIPLARHIDVG